MRVEDVTPALMVKNEDYWIHYVLRDLFRVFGRVVMIDTGSTDWTKEISYLTADQFDCDFTFIEENFGNDAEKIGNSRNVLRQKTETEWMFLVDGDEIWSEEQLDKLLTLDVPDDKLVVMVLAKNLVEEDGTIYRRDEWSADRLFRPSVVWDRVQYPFESHGLDVKAAAGELIYTDAFFWHTRHLIRSSKDDEAFFRDEKRAYYPWDGPLKEIPSDWLGEIEPVFNPYLEMFEW